MCSASIVDCRLSGVEFLSLSFWRLAYVAWRQFSRVGPLAQNLNWPDARGEKGEALDRLSLSCFFELLDPQPTAVGIVVEFVLMTAGKNYSASFFVLVTGVIF
jgi:hypothetical protein